MSHPLYNPYAAGNQSSNQPPYGRSSLQSGVDPQRQIYGLGPGSSFSSSAVSSAVPANPGGRMPTLLAPSAGYRPEPSQYPVDEDLERSIDMHVSRAREGHISGHGQTSSFRPSAVSSATPANSRGRVPPLLALSASYRPEQSRAGMGVDVHRSKDMHISRAREVTYQGKQDHQPTGQSALFPSTQRDVVLSSGTGRTSYPMASTSASLGPRRSDVGGGSSSLDWLTKYRRAATDDSSKLYSSPASSSYTSSKFNSSSDRVSEVQSIPRDVQSIPGLGDFDYPVQDEPPTETSRPKYTSESASNILLQFGLEKDDLEYLISYPEDQITPANLPFILRQIRNQKAKRPSTGVEPKPYPETQPIRGVRARDNLSSSGGSSAVVQPTKVIEYGHTGKYVGAMVDEASGRTSGRSADSSRRADSGSMSYDTYEHHSSSNRQEQLQKDTPEVKSGALSTSRVQTSSVTNVSPSYTSSRSSVASPSGDRAKRSKTKPNQTPQPTFNSFSLPKKDTETRVLTSEAAKPLAFKEPEDDRPSLSKLPQSPTAASLSPPGLQSAVVVNKTYPSGTESKTQGQQLVVPEQTKKLQMQPKQKVQTPKAQATQKAQMLKAPTTQKAQAQQMQKVQTTLKAQTTHKAEATQKAQTTQGAQTQPVPQTGNRFWTPVLPAGFLTPHQWDVFGLMTPSLVKLPGPAKLPTAAMMFDYTAASPRVFPHTCSLCHKECTSMTDWISHQNTSLHIGNCRNVRTLYPEWNGEIVPELSAAANDAEPSASTSTAAKTSSQERHGSRSRSNSPRKKRSRSRSSPSSRYTRSLSRSRSPRYGRYRSRSRSHERRRGRDGRRLSSSSEERGGRRRSPRRRTDRRRSPRRSHPSPRRRSRDRRLSPSRRDDKPSPRMSRERRSPSEVFTERRSGNAEKLVKKLLENSAVQSLSAQSDLDAVVKSLTPALLAELAKMKSSPSSSKGGKKPDSPSSSSSSAKKPNMQKSEVEKSSTPTIVRLEGVNCSMSHGDLFAAVEHYGKTKSVLIIRSKREAVVCFENEEHARRLSNLGTVTVKGIVIRVATKMMAQHKETPQKKPDAATKTNTPGLARPSTSLKTSPQEKKPLPAGATTKTVAKDLTKVTKAKTAATKPIANVALAEPTRVSDVVSEVKVKEGTTSPAGTTVKEEAVKKSAEPIEVTLKSTEVVRSPSAKAEGPVPEANVKTPEASDESQLPQPESSAGPALEVKTGASQPSSSTKGTDENTTQEDLASAVTSQSVPAPAQDASQVVGNVTGAPSEAAVAAAIESRAMAKASCSPAKITSDVTCTLTIGEMADSLLFVKSITCSQYRVHLSKKSLEIAKRTLMIWNLPRYDDWPYTERDLVQVLSPHGFEYEDENIYVVPQSRLAFITLPTMKKVHHIQHVYKPMQLALKFCPLKMGSVKFGIEMSPIGLYNSLMRRMNSPVIDDGIRTIYIKNISPSEVRSLRETLRKIGSITNFLPLLNKVFVEFESDRDADRLGVWYGLLKRRPAYKLRRLNILRCDSTALLPKMAVNAMPESGDIVAGAVVPILKFGVPQGSSPPFSITLRTDPYVFSTVSPWFIIPEYLSLKESGSIESANSHGSTPTIMLTALPEEGYSHEDVAKLVWPYFPQRDLHSLYYNVIVLPLQRRAFVHFSDWDTCRRFARDHVAKTLFVQGHAIKIHFVLQNMFPESKEELLYTSMMKWSNAGVPDPVGLEERLICFEVSETTADLITMVMSVVQSIATFINFLPLANRICVEMSNSAGVALVLGKFNTSLLGPHATSVTWKKVIGFVPLKTLKQRLEEANEIAIDLGVTPAKATPPSQPPPPAAESSSVAARDVETNLDGEKLQLPIAPGTTLGPQADRDVERRQEGSPSGPAPAASAVVMREVTTGGLQPINQGTVKTLKAAVQQHRPTQERKRPSEERESSSKGSTSRPSVKRNESASRAKRGGCPYLDPVDFTDDNITADAYLFDDQNFAMSDFVTVDEVGSDAHFSSHTKKARKRNRQHLALRSSLSSPSSSSKSAGVAAKKPKDSSQSTKPTSTSSSSSSLSQRKATESAVAASNLRVAAEGTAAKSVQSEPGIETSSEMRPPAQGRASGSNRDQNLEGQTKKDDVVLVENEEGDFDEVIDLTQLLEPQNGRVLNKENFQVLDSVSDDGEACPEAKSGEDSTAGNGSATGQEEGSGLVQRDGSTTKQLSEEDVILVGDRSDDKPALEEATVENQETNIDNSVQVSTASRRRASSGQEGAKKRKQKEEEDKMISKESDKPLKQIPTEERPRGVSDQKDVDEPETFKILDSIDDQTAMDDGGQKAETPGAQTSSDKAEEEEEEETYQVVDSVDDLPTTAEAESEVDATARKDGVSSKRSGPRTRASKSEDKEKSPRKRDRTSQKSSEEGREIEEEVYEILDSIGDEPAQDVPATEKSVRRRSQRGKREDRTEVLEKPDGDEETLYKVLDSVEDEAATEEPAITTRPTRGRRGRTRRKDYPKEEDTPTRRRQTPARESQDRMTKNEGKASPTEEGEGAKKKSDIITEREARDEDVTYEILDSVEDEEVVDLAGDVTQQETFEILDSTDIETKEDIVRVEEAEEEEEVTYQVVDSVDDQPTTVETEVEATAGKDGGSSKRTRQVRTVTTSKIVSEIDSGECERVQDVTATERSVRRRSQRGRTEDKTEASEKPDGVEEASYEILDSIEEDGATEEPTTTRSTRGRTRKKESPKEEATPKRRGRTPARESQQEIKKKSDAVPVREVRDEGATYEILDSFEDEEVVKEERPAAGGRGRRGRPKKAAKATKKKTVTLKQSDKEEEEVSYQILDSVEGEMVDDPPPAEQSVSVRKKKTSIIDRLVEKRSSVSGSPRNEEEEEEEEEPVYQILDSVEGDQVQEESAKESSRTEDETRPEEEAPAVEEDSPTCSRVAAEASQELVGKDREEESGLEKKEDRSDARKEDASTSAEEKEKNPESTRRQDTASALVNLDEVSDEEEDYPDDTAEEEELRKRQATVKHKQLAKEREERKTGEREERQRRGRSSQSGGRKERGEGQEVKVDTEEQEREQEERKAKEAEEEEEDIKELVTLDEVGADEAGEEASEQGQEWDGDITAEELQGLVTLDEIVEEEEEGRAEQSPPELFPPSKEKESVDSLNPEGKTKNQAGGDEEGENRDEAETSLRSVKRKGGDDSESANFVTVDEVEEEEEEEVKEAPRTRGRPRKKSRKTPVRKSTRGKKAVAEDERVDERESGGCDPPPLKDPPTSLGDCRPEIQKAEEDGASQAHVDAASAGQDPQDLPPESQSLEALSRVDVTVVSKRTRAELVGPEVKRSRTRSPCSSADLKLPAFSPDNPLGQEFVVPKSGYFCNLCRVFYLNESTAKEQHCGSQRHYDNLQKHYQKLEDEQSRRSSSTQLSQGSVSD